MNTTNKWDYQSLVYAIKHVRDGGKYADSCRLFKVPATTLRRRCSQDTNIETIILKKGHKPILPKYLEESLTIYIKHCADRLLGLTCDDVNRAAYTLANRNEIIHNFNDTIRMAGKDWLCGFRKRNSGLSKTYVNLKLYVNMIRYK